MSRHQGRTYVVTGAESDIGELTAALLEDEGARVLRCGAVDDLDVRADLVGDLGRDMLVSEVGRLAPSGIDGLVLIAEGRAATAEAVHVDYFGMLAALAGLRPLLRLRPAPRVVVVSSAVTLTDGDADVITACLRGDEEAAHTAAEHAVAAGRGGMLYRSAKIALNRWVRQSATADEWAGTGVVVNVVAPGVVEEGEGAQGASRDTARTRMLNAALPQPLGFPGPSRAVAAAISWMVSEENSFMAGQIVFVDGGADAALRADRPYLQGVRYGPLSLGRMLFWGVRSKVGVPLRRARRGA
ncbi:SDR family oxidoreductase [Brachybacterium sp. YJGR34]|uniref:SDR family oxidoreductase n=1 Tax=Brachybacterium sp. YJGR34 TaxID=2059911 RepID=UPI000E0C0659|nr:SDR family oxidoreductase [Brachybacterium sp. YJGR34]